MGRLVLALPVLCMAWPLLHGCTRTSKHTGAAASLAEGGPTAAPEPSRFSTTPACYSAPIAAARVNGVDVVAGLVASEGVVRAMGLGAGRVAWTVDVLRSVGWTADAELRVFPAADGFAVLWRGLLDGKSAFRLLVRGPRGEERGEPFPIGPISCNTVDGFAWIGPHEGGHTAVFARGWAEGRTREIAAMPHDRDPSLVCGEHDVIVLGDGDEDLTATRFAFGNPVPPRPTVVLRDEDFGEDEREHDAYSTGDDLGLVRIGASGAIALREVPRVGPPAPWRKLKHALSEDDEVVVVDGDAASTFLVVTHETEGACPDAGAASESIRALRVDRATGGEALWDLAPADCGRSRGPFWLAAADHSRPVIAWTERRAGMPPKAAAIAGMAVRTVLLDGVHAGWIEQQADALVDGGCYEAGCIAAALVREQGTEGMQPEPIRVFSYP